MRRNRLGLRNISYAYPGKLGITTDKGQQNNYPLVLDAPTESYETMLIRWQTGVFEVGAPPPVKPVDPYYFNADFILGQYRINSESLSSDLFFQTWFSRPSAASFIDEKGQLQIVSSNVPRRRNGYLLLEEGTTNEIRNPFFSGSIDGLIANNAGPGGNAGARPTNSAIRGSLVSGLSVYNYSGQEDGRPYLDFRVAGTSAISGSVGLYFEPSTQIQTSASDVWTLSLERKLVFVSGSFINMGVNFVERNSGGAGTGASPANRSYPLRSIEPVVQTHLINTATTQRIQPGFELFHGTGVLDVTVRVYLPQIEKKKYKTSFSFGSRSDEIISLPALSGQKQLVIEYEDKQLVTLSRLNTINFPSVPNTNKGAVKSIMLNDDPGIKFSWTDAKPIFPTLAASLPAFTPYEKWSVGRYQAQERDYAFLKDVGRIDVHKFETRFGDGPEPGVNEKSEIQTLKSYLGSGFDGSVPYDTGVWCAYSFLLEPRPPATASFTILGQWHATEDYGATAPGRAIDDALPPVMCFYLDPQGRFSVDTRAQTNEQQLVSNPPPTLTRYKATAPIERGIFHDIAFRVRFNYTSGAELEAWMDGVNIVSASGIAIGYNDVVGPHWNFGIYRGPEDTSPEAAVYANMEIGYTDLSARIGKPRPI